MSGKLTTNLGDAAQSKNILTDNINTTTITDINGNTGLVGQFLSSTALGIDWVPAGVTPTPNLQAVCTVGASYNNIISVTGVTDCATIDNTVLGTTAINSFRTNLNGFTNINKSAHSITAFISGISLTSDLSAPQVIPVPDPDWNCIAIDIVTANNAEYICFILDTTGGKQIDLTSLVYSFTLVSAEAYVLNLNPIIPVGFYASQVSSFEAFFFFPFSAFVNVPPTGYIPTSVPIATKWRFSFISWEGGAI
jgi:hypothetical protein